MDEALRDKDIAVVTHSFSTGPPQELKEYLASKARTLLYVSHPFPYCVDTRSWMELYEGGVRRGTRRAPTVRGPEAVYYVKDVFLTLWYALRTGRRFDVYIGADGLNALCGLLLRRLGRVKKVVYYSIDYVPRRFEGRLMNSIYHFVDRLCCRGSDFMWDISPKTSEARFSNGVSRERYAPRHVVPNGANFSRMKRLPLEEIKRHEIAFMGHLRKNQGVELAIGAMPKILDKVPDAGLTVIGTGPLEEELRRLASLKGVESNVRFTGFIEDHAELEDILSRCAIGVAPYVPSDDNFTYYGDPGKIKSYMAAGLPVITTSVPLISSEIRKREAGVVIGYDEDELAGAVVRLLTDPALYSLYRRNAIGLGSDFDWARIFDDAFRATFSGEARRA